MPTPVLPSNTQLAAVRSYLGLTQGELGDYLGVTAAQIGHVEAGRCGFKAEPMRRLRYLARLLPAPLGEALASDPGSMLSAPTLRPVEATRLRKRLRACRYQARDLRHQLGLDQSLAAAYQRRVQALAALHGALLALAPPPDPLEAPIAVRLLEWLPQLAAGTARAGRVRLSPAARTLLALRLRHLEEEEAALVGLLGGG